MEMIDVPELPNDGYLPEYCEQLIEFFDQPAYKIVTGEKGETAVIPNDLPLFSSFAKSIKVSQLRLRQWAKVHPDFKEAMDLARDMQESTLITNSLRGLYASSPANFAAKNLLGWTDRVQNQTVTEINVKALMDRVDGNTENKNFLDD